VKQFIPMLHVTVIRMKKESYYKGYLKGKSTVEAMVDTEYLVTDVSILQQ